MAGNLIPDYFITDKEINPNAAIARSKLALETKAFGVPLTELRVWDAFGTNLPATPAADDLGIVGGTFGTNSPVLRSQDLKAATGTNFGRFQFVVPPEYEAGRNLTVRLKANMVTTVASSAATVDVQAFKSNGAAGIGSDLCATNAISINSLTAADRDFTITGTTLQPGDVLDIRIATAVTDSATATAVIAQVGAISVLCPIRG